MNTNKDEGVSVKEPPTSVKIKKKVVISGKSVDMTQKVNNSFLPLALGIAMMLLAGIGTGYALSRSKVQGVSVSETGSRTIESEKVVGSLDETFSDEAEGILQDGGFEGEGTHHLERDGGVSQYVYLTSSVVALDDYVGKNVKVWGETFDAQKAGWLMDVGKLEVLE